jgi:hypothetical protein
MMMMMSPAMVFCLRPTDASSHARCPLTDGHLLSPHVSYRESLSRIRLAAELNLQWPVVSALRGTLARAVQEAQTPLEAFNDLVRQGRQSGRQVTGLDGRCERGWEPYGADGRFFVRACADSIDGSLGPEGHARPGRAVSVGRQSGRQVTRGGGQLGLMLRAVSCSVWMASRRIGAGRHTDRIGGALGLHQGPDLPCVWCGAHMQVMGAGASPTLAQLLAMGADAPPTTARAGSLSDVRSASSPRP